RYPSTAIMVSITFQEEAMVWQTMSIFRCFDREYLRGKTGEDEIQRYIPTLAEPTSAESTSAEPTSAKPSSAMPSSAKPTSAEPTSAEPTSAKPSSAAKT